LEYLILTINDISLPDLIQSIILYEPLSAFSLQNNGSLSTGVYNSNSKAEHNDNEKRADWNFQRHLVFVSPYSIIL
jgi:hypothetical protein